MGNRNGPGCRCCGPPPPPCPEPEAIRVYVRDYCTLAPAEGATVTARDVAEVFGDATAYADADGLAVVELDGPGTFDVDVTVGGCTETIEGVVVLECERLRLPDAAPCCGQMCLDVYDYDTADPIAGAAVSGTWAGGHPATDAGGLSCGPPHRTSPVPGIDRYSVSAAGYIPRNNYATCLDCDCEATQTIPVALFPESDYVIGGCGALGTHCPAEDLCDATGRPPTIYKREMFADLSGPEPIFGAGASGLSLALISGASCPRIWEGWTAGGYGWAVEQEFNATTRTYTEVGRTRLDFPTARVRVVSGETPPITFGNQCYLEWQNFVDDPGTVPATGGLVLSSVGTPGTTGYRRTILLAERYCTVSGFDIYTYPLAVRNHAAPSGNSVDGVCVASRWLRAPDRHEYRRELSALMCAPVDVAGTFWCSQPCGPYSYGTETASYALYE